jgi:hypothetical protein
MDLKVSFPANPICRSITGAGVRETLALIRALEAAELLAPGWGRSLAVSRGARRTVAPKTGRKKS